MKINVLLMIIFGSLLFLAGILLELSLSAAVAWGEIEARIYSSQTGSLALNIECPLVLATSQAGLVSAVISNTLDAEALPVVTAEISHVGREKLISQNLYLGPHASQTVQWEVDASDMIFDRLILVNITQGRYSDLPSRQGACGILLLSLLGLNGIQTFSLLSLTSLALIVIGATIWLRARSPLDDLGRSMTQASGALAGIATAGLLSALARLWGLIMLLDGISMLLIVVIFTDLVLFPKNNGN